MDDDDRIEDDDIFTREKVDALDELVEDVGTADMDDDDRLEGDDNVTCEIMDTLDGLLENV